MKNRHLFNRIIILLFGSWMSIVVHTIIFVIIMLTGYGLLVFNTIVSIEAIYIGIFILMAEYRQEAEKEEKDMHYRYSDRKLVREDVSITQNVMDEIKELKHHQTQSTKALQEIRELLASTSTTTTP